jgi:hypothetical protein
MQELAFLYIKSNHGIDTEPTYPYEAHRHKCRFDPKNIGATDTVNICLQDYNERLFYCVSGFCSN